MLETKGHCFRCGKFRDDLTWYDDIPLCPPCFSVCKADMKLRRELIDKAYEMGITLNGKHARAAGVMNRFVSVYQTNGALRIEYSWDTFQRILNNGKGEFKA